MTTHTLRSALERAVNLLENTDDFAMSRADFNAWMLERDKVLTVARLAVSGEERLRSLLNDIQTLLVNEQQAWGSEAQYAARGRLRERAQQHATACDAMQQRIVAALASPPDAREGT